MGASVSLSAGLIDVDPGGEAAVELRVQNRGQVVDQFALEVLGAAAEWATVEPATLNLFPGKEEKARIRFRPPRASGTPAGEVPFGVRVRSREDPAGGAVEEGTLLVGAFRQTEAELVPRSSRGRFGARHELALDNRGNVRMRALLAGQDPSNRLRFRFAPAALTAPPGGAAIADVHVRPRGVAWTGPPRSHSFQLQLTLEDERPQVLDATMVQGPVFGPWVRTAAMVAAAAIVLAAGFWFLAVKPAVESTARDAIAGSLAQQAAAISHLQQQGTGGGATPTAGPTPVATVNPTPTPAPPAFFSRRLDFAGGGRDHYTVPSGQTLEITDLVFENAQGEHGTVVLQRDAAVLLTENLDNFRDLDLHFVTPVTASGGQTVQLVAQCTAPPGCTHAAVLIDGTQRKG
ncbi:MAG TPA: hypothetical protein VKF59_01330 [Candidatus Dormibacteraeota bacterium]|nr:hypothetical protein [Candidatus Dormibacteraeota bacterium]